MKEILKILDRKGEMKKKDIFGLLKTNSKKINSLITKKVKSFSNIDDFLNHYSNQTTLLKLLNESEFNYSKNYDELLSSFDSNIEQYISCFTQIIISIKLIFKAQEILNKVFLISKQYLSKLKIEQQIENISQENLFSFIENLLDFFGTKALRSFSIASESLNCDSCDSVNNNLINDQKSIKDQSSQLLINVDFGKALKILDEEPSTPKFGLKSDKNIKNFEKENCHNIYIRKNSSFSFSSEKDLNPYKDETSINKNKRNNTVSKNAEYNNITNKQNYENLLEMINNIYRKGIINSEEKIKLKQLVIGKSKKLENLYHNIYKNKFIDQNILRSGIEKLV